MTDTYPTTDKTLEVTYIGHASVMFRYGDEIIHVDPYGDIADYSGLPKADLILITHHHGDHLKNGEETAWNEFRIRATAAYNRIAMRSPGVPFHIKGEGNGYLLEVANLRIYIAGDTELIPEMEKLGPVDIAFLPKNLPYTMSDQMFVETARLIRPTYLYPYHYFEVDRETLQKALPAIRIR